MAKIGDLCPLFFSPIKDKFGNYINYIQRFHSSDTILLQLFTRIEEGNGFSFVLNDLIAGTSAETTRYSHTMEDAGIRMFYSKVSNLPDSIYTVTTMGKTSEPFMVCSSDEILKETVLIRYSHRDNNSAFDNIFWIGSEQQVFEFRVEAGFKPTGYAPKVDNEQYRNQMQEAMDLYAIPYDVYTLSVGNASGVPYWFARFLNRILCLSMVEIDGTRYVRSESSVPELSQVLEDSQLFHVSIALELKRNILWSYDDEKKFTITVNINSNDIGKCTITAIGDVVNIYQSSDGGTYTIIGLSKGNVTIQVMPEKGYRIGELTVDGVSQGDVSEYTFENLNANHEVNVSLEILDGFLVRSDLPSMYYSGMQDVFNALKASYPDGLTQNVTISCVKPAKEKRKGGHYLASLADWNQRSMHTLTIDGKNDLYLNGNALGCLAFSNVDNIIIKDIHFEDFSNYVGYQVPDALGAISFTGKISQYARNMFVGGCTFNGKSMTDETVMSTNSVILINTENVTINNSSFTDGGGPVVNANTCSLLSILNNDFVLAPVGVGYPTAVTVSGGKILILEDNRMSGDNRYSFASITNIDKAYIRRNSFRDGGSMALSVSSSVPMSKLVIESNLFAGMLSNTGSINTWAQAVIGLCPIRDMELSNNTFYMSGNNGQQYCTRWGAINRLKIFNNVVVDAGHAVHFIYGFAFDNVSELVSDYNVFQYKLHDNITYGSLLRVFNMEGVEGSVEINADQGCRFWKIQELGYDIHSVLVSDGVDADALDNNLMITTALDAGNPANNENVPDIDLAYKLKSASANSRGCYNLHGSVIDETSVVLGYTGSNMEDGSTFSNASQYGCMAEDILMLKAKALNRNLMPVFSVIGSADSYLVLGRYGLLSPLPILDINGEYVEDELYDINVE